ncbi:MAG: PEGA domain-containing protein [Planctomycetes bacterium]|nr:PEGA domain-containing protein [Planctomycetota bacterium]
MPFQLTILEGRDKGKSFPVEEGRAIILGRGLNSDVRLEDEKVSRSHCRIEPGDGGFFLSDLKSLNGTFLGTQAVARKRLSHGDCFRVGSTQVQFLAVEAPSPAAAGAAPLASAARPVRWRRVSERVLPWVAAASVLLGLAGLAQNGFSGSRAIRVRSDPPEAMVFLDERYAGQTPLEGIALTRGPHLLRVEKDAFLTHQGKIEARFNGPDLLVRLQPVPTGCLEVASVPTQAEVYVDAEFRGRTPVTLEGLPLGEHEVRLVLTDYLSVQERVALLDARPVRRELVLKQELVQFYEGQIEREPDSAQNYTELAHLHVLHQRFDEAIQALENALSLVTEGKDNSGYGSRLHQEIAKAYRSDHYDYGDYQSIARLRTMIEEMLERVTDRYPSFFQNYKLLIEFYQQSGRNDKIAALYGKAYQRMPRSWQVAKGYGTALMAAGQHADARDVFQKSRSEMPGNWEAHYLHGLAYLRGARSPGDRAQAASSLEQALKLCARGGPVAEIRRALDEARR